MSDREWAPLGEPDESRAAAARGLAASITVLETGQFFVLETVPAASVPDEVVWVAVANYGHNLLMLEVPGDDMLPANGRLTREQQDRLREFGFVAPSGCHELVGRGDTWHWPFGIHDAVAAAEMVVWVQEVIFCLPHPLLMSDVRGGSLLDSGPQPCLHDVQMHTLSGMHHG